MVLCVHCRYTVAVIYVQKSYHFVFDDLESGDWCAFWWRAVDIVSDTFSSLIAIFLRDAGRAL